MNKLVILLVSVTSIFSIACDHLTAQELPSTQYFEGVWSGTLTRPKHDFWNIEDFSCFAGCPKESYELHTALLDDPANDERPLSRIKPRGS